MTDVTAGDDSERNITGCKIHSKRQQQHIDTHHAVYIMDDVNKLHMATTRWGQICCVCMKQRCDFIYLCILCISPLLSSQNHWDTIKIAHLEEMLLYRCYITMFWLTYIVCSLT